MPYIKDDGTRAAIDWGVKNAVSNCVTEGDLNYAVTRLIDLYILANGGVRYNRINEVMGVLECAKLEFYRRVAQPYEDQKRIENGDVYDSLG